MLVVRAEGAGALMADEDEELFLIWSIEHNAWWRAGRWGYSQHLADAGFYTKAEAVEICRGANIVKTNECMIPRRSFRVATP